MTLIHQTFLRQVILLAQTKSAQPSIDSRLHFIGQLILGYVSDPTFQYRAMVFSQSIIWMTVKHIIPDATLGRVSHVLDNIRIFPLNTLKYRIQLLFCAAVVQELAQTRRALQELQQRFDQSAAENRLLEERFNHDLAALSDEMAKKDARISELIQIARRLLQKTRQT